jgi:hypothetical protein
MSELTKEFERIIEDTSGGTHNSQDWWDMDLCGTETIIEGLCRRLESAALSAIPELPPVAPENLVEGEWYVFHVDGGCDDIRYFDGVLLWEASSDLPFDPTTADGELFTIYGPLRFKTGGAK